MIIILKQEINNMLILYPILFILFTFFASENRPETIILTLQYPNSTRVSLLWNIDDFNKLEAIKRMHEDTAQINRHSENKTSMLLPLSKDHLHVTHAYLKNLITGNFKPNSQYLNDYDYFIGNNDIDLYGETAATVKKKVFREHVFTDSKQYNQAKIKNFFSYDLKKFLQETLKFDFENFYDEMILDDTNNLTNSTDEIINSLKPVINIEIETKFNSFSMSIESTRYFIVDSPCLLNLIRLIAWKKSLEPKSKFLNKKELLYHYNEFFYHRIKPVQKIHFKNFLFLNLYIEKILNITRKISFIDSKITLSDNDITALQKIRNANITLHWQLFSVYGPYWSYFNTFGQTYKKYSLEINFSTSHVANPDKALELIDLYNGYFQTILLKNIPVNQNKLWFKKLLCRKWARFKFCISVGVNLCILGTLLAKGGLIWKLCIVSIGGGLSFIIQLIIYLRMINYPETSAQEYAKEPFDTNGGVTFE